MVILIVILLLLQSTLPLIAAHYNILIQNKFNELSISISFLIYFYPSIEKNTPPSNICLIIPESLKYKI